LIATGLPKRRGVRGLPRPKGDPESGDRWQLQWLYHPDTPVHMRSYAVVGGTTTSTLALS
jgi:hypothetical protein